MGKDCPNCPAFGKHCPHRVSGDPYHYDCTMTVEDLEKENAELKSENQKWKDEWQEQVQKENDESYTRTLQTIQLTKAKEIIKTLAADLSMYSGNYQKELLEAKQFLSEVEK